MSKRATDAKVMEYLWPSRRLAQRERTMNNPRMTSVGIAAALLLFSALLFGERAEAGQFIRANELLEWCESDDAMDFASCARYITGVADITDTYQKTGAIDPIYCRPKGVSVGQLMKVVTKGLNERAEYLHEGAAGLTVVVFAEAFPCD